MPTQELATYDTINSNDKIAEKLYSLGTWFVSFMQGINTQHKGDNDDDDNDDDNNNNNNNNNLLHTIAL